MDSEHLKTKRYLKNIGKKDEFCALLDKCVLSETEMQIITMHYFQEKNLAYIGDMLGFSESTIKKKHKKILEKIIKVI